MFILGALAQRSELVDQEASRKATTFLLDCWANRGRVKYPGHDSQIESGWEKLKYPFTDYRILKFLDVLSSFPAARGDPRINDMLTLLGSKGDEEGRFRPESVVKVWTDFDFGQRKEPSRWLTMLAWRVMGRCGGEL